MVNKDGKAGSESVLTPFRFLNVAGGTNLDECLIYESVGPKQIIGTARVIKESYPDPKDIAWVCVDIELGTRLNRPISLAELKEHQVLKSISLVKQSRLSVSPISLPNFRICETL